MSSKFEKMLLLKSSDSYYQRLWCDIKNKEIYFFGASGGSNQAQEWISSQSNETDYVLLKGMFDNDADKWGVLKNGIMVFNPETFFQEGKYCNEIILVTCGSAGDIIPQLMSYGVSEDRIKIFSLMSYRDEYDKFRNNLLSHIDDFETVYEMLGDSKSKKTFVNLINFRLTGDFNFTKEIAEPIEDQYFDKDLIKYDENDVYLDCGAYTGDTAANYIRHNSNKYKEIISIEASPFEYIKLVKNTYSNKKICCINKGVWAKHGSLKFTGNFDSWSNHFSEDGDIEVETESIDNILGEKKIAHIKMDIEGAEVPALVGAYDTITRDKPTLAICVYHRVDDFIRVPLLIKSFNPDYSIYFRHYQKLSAMETVCYAIVKK